VQLEISDFGFEIYFVQFQNFYLAISSSCFPRVSIMRVAAKAPMAAVAANIKNTECVPFELTTKPTTSGPTAEASRNQQVARPVPIARIRVG
jgi:hypothetical protein